MADTAMPKQKTKAELARDVLTYISACQSNPVTSLEALAMVTDAILQTIARDAPANPAARKEEIEQLLGKVKSGYVAMCDRAKAEYRKRVNQPAGLQRVK